MAEYEVFASDGKTHGVILVRVTARSKLDFVAFRPQLLRCLSIYWFYFAYRTRHMQNEDSICHQNYFQGLYQRRDLTFYEGRVRSGDG